MGAGNDETLRRPGGAAQDARGFGAGTLAAERYRIDRFIASGGMGEVYAAHDLVLGVDVALKTLRPELEGSATAIARLRREIALARAVTDSHVCRLHDVGEHAGRVFLTMELLDGCTLGELIKERPLSLDEIERLARQLVAGLGALHRAGIVHRDFKTSNVIVVGDRVVISDFGLARSTGVGDAKLTADASLLGTPAYMAPEQVEARPATSASDIYAFGVVLFEMLTGALPFSEDTSMATATARLYRDAPKPSAMRADVSPRWDAIVGRCLARDPAARFASVDDVLELRPSRRGFLIAAGGGAVAATALGFAGVRAFRSDDGALARGADDLVAVLPVSGTTELGQDPWRLALTLDLRDELATTDLALLGLDEGVQSPTIDGTARIVGDALDPITAAFALPRVTAVVQTAILSRTSATIGFAIAITRRGELRSDLVLWSPIRAVSKLVHDAAVAIADALGATAPRARREDAPDYGRYARAVPLVAMRRRLKLGDVLEATAGIPRAAARLADYLIAVAEDETLQHVDKAVDAALAADPDRALAHAVRGHTAALRWQWADADRSTKHALELAPNDERVAFHRALVVMLKGRFEEGVPLMERFCRRDPESTDAQTNLGWAYYYARRWPDTVRQLEPLNQLPERRGLLAEAAPVFLALAYAEMTRFAEAKALADRIRASKTDPYWKAMLVPVYVLTGHADDANAIRIELGDAPGLLGSATMDDYLGDLDSALAKLEKLVAGHSLDSIFLNIERFTPTLRAHPRFQKLLQTIGLG